MNNISYSAFQSILQWGLLIKDITGEVDQQQLREEAQRLIQAFGHQAEIESALQTVTTRLI